MLSNADTKYTNKAQWGNSSNTLANLSLANGYAGAGIGLIETTAGAFRVGSNLKIYGATASGRVFQGNQFTKTLGIQGSMQVFGLGSLAAGAILDYQGTQIYKSQGANAEGAVHPGKAIVNTGLGTWATAVGGIVGLTGGIAYWGIDTFYPGGMACCDAKEF